MKKVLLILAAGLLLVLLAACGAAEPEAAAPAPAETGAQSLVVYFSRTGNTEAVAQEIAAQTGAELCRLEPAVPYPTEYQDLLTVAQAEQADETRPALAEMPPDLAAYDTIYLGSPIWCGDLPMLLYTFLDQADLSGKTVAPFVTSGSSGAGETAAHIQAQEPQALVTECLSLTEDQLDSTTEDVAAWLRDVVNQQ